MTFEDITEDGKLWAVRYDIQAIREFKSLRGHLGQGKGKREQEIWTRFVAETLCNKISVQFLFGDGRGDQTDAFNAGEGTYFGRVEEVGEGQEFYDFRRSIRYRWIL